MLSKDDDIITSNQYDNNRTNYCFCERRGSIFTIVKWRGSYNTSTALLMGCSQRGREITVVAAMVLDISGDLIDIIVLVHFGVMRPRDFGEKSVNVWPVCIGNRSGP